MTERPEHLRDLYINTLRVSWGQLNRRDRKRLWKRHQLLAISLRKLLDEGWL